MQKFARNLFNVHYYNLIVERNEDIAESHVFEYGCHHSCNSWNCPFQKNTFQAKNSVEVYSVHLRGAFGTEIVIDKLTSMIFKLHIKKRNVANVREDSGIFT